MCTSSAGCIRMAIQGPTWKALPGLGRHQFLCCTFLEPQAVGNHSREHSAETPLDKHPDTHTSLCSRPVHRHNPLESRGFQEVIIPWEATVNLVASAPPPSTLILGELIPSQSALCLQLWWKTCHVGTSPTAFWRILPEVGPFLSCLELFPNCSPENTT